eukprot:CAMPEP_0170323030 /NCGR_PEP_ID=MMETSP0116_2-20130129/62305_1 /TAXON_ID=400756 /ORGANISM="Durinskia baltica, Strain CSIRO CS-38" /LENGTH=145 /DNA_ID=CAMNT_0010575913 /DNA_START=112 /DNA_END=549 /DNA_ORIENTATION=-
MADTAAVPPSTNSTTTSSSGTKSKTNFAEVQETMSRLAAHKGVTAVLILNRTGDILTQTGNGTVGNPKLLKQTLDAAAHYLHSIPSDDDDEDTENQGVDHDGSSQGDTWEKLSFVRIRSKREEILVAPKNQYVLVVLQDPSLAPL